MHHVLDNYPWRQSWPKLWNSQLPYKPGLSLVTQMVKSLLKMQETQVQSLGWEDSLEKGMATDSSIVAWEIQWTEERGGLQFMGLQRVGHDWITNTDKKQQQQQQQKANLNSGLACFFQKRKYYIEPYNTRTEKELSLPRKILSSLKKKTEKQRS